MSEEPREYESRPERAPDRPERRERHRDDREEGSGRYASMKARLRAKARKRARKKGRRVFRGKKVSRLTTDKSLEIDYKDARVLRMFLSETGKVIPRRISGNTAKQQREIVQAVKRARHLAILPYTDNTQ